MVWAEGVVVWAEGAVECVVVWAEGVPCCPNVGEFCLKRIRVDDCIPVVLPEKRSSYFFSCFDHERGEARRGSTPTGVLV